MTPYLHVVQHSFPQDFRSGPSPFDWDPSKWAIIVLHYLGLASGLRRARGEEIHAARDFMIQKESWSNSSAHSSDATTPTSSDYESDQWDGECWSRQQVIEYAQKNNRCMIVLGGYAVDVTRYLGEHVRLSYRGLLALPRECKGAHAVDSLEVLLCCDGTQSGRNATMGRKTKKGTTPTGHLAVESTSILRRPTGACANSAWRRSNENG